MLLLMGPLVAACVHRPAAEARVLDPASTLPFSFSARPTRGEVRVVPAVAVYEPMPVNLDDYVGRPVGVAREALRRQRVRQLDALPDAIGWALPGEVNGRLGQRWGGQFRVWDLGLQSRDRLAGAVAGRGPGIDATLSSLARSVGGKATLFCWVTELRGEPLSLTGFPGEVLETAAGPVMLEHHQEPYLVSAQVGLALVTADGEVVVRYHDHVEAVMAEDTERAGRELARALAKEVDGMWSTDVRLLQHEPDFR